MGINVSSLLVSTWKGKGKKAKKSKTTGLIGLLSAHSPLRGDEKKHRQKKREAKNDTGKMLKSPVASCLKKKRKNQRTENHRYLGSPGNRRRDKGVAEGFVVYLPLLGSFCHVWPAQCSDPVCVCVV